MKKVKNYEQMIKEHDEHTGRAKIIADTARAHFMRPAYAGTIAEVKGPYENKRNSTKTE